MTGAPGLRGPSPARPAAGDLLAGPRTRPRGGSHERTAA